MFRGDKRRKVRRGKSRRLFRRAAGSTHYLNKRPLARGGIRL